MAAEPSNNWLFSLTNFSVTLCDEKTELPLPKDAPQGAKPGWLLNRINFEVEGRQWVLIDKLVGQRPLPRSETEGVALFSGELITKSRQNDRIDDLLAIVDPLCMLLSFAVSRDVAAPDVYRESGGKLSFAQRRATRVHLFNQGRIPLIDNSNHGELQSFIEAAYPRIKPQMAWWLKTLDFFVQSRTNHFLEIQSALLNILLDRIAASHPENRAGGEVARLLARDKDPIPMGEVLEKLLKNVDFKAKLTALFAEPLPTWTSVFTERYILSYLTNCNRRPSFSAGIQRVCKKYGEPEPEASFLGTRNKLLHEGDLDPKDGEVLKYVLELDSLVSRLLLRMLGYTGHYYDLATRANVRLSIAAA